MKVLIVSFIALLLLGACTNPTVHTTSGIPLAGTWQLFSATIIDKGDTITTDYSKDLRMIKVINDSHFSFLNHDLKQGKDSTALFIAGGGRYTLVGDQYTEFLEYCSDRAWEGHDFKFNIKVSNDTLTQTGREEVKEKGIERLNIERYVRVR